MGSPVVNKDVIETIICLSKVQLFLFLPVPNVHKGF